MHSSRGAKMENTAHNIVCGEVNDCTVRVHQGNIDNYAAE